ncbi:hypothetical protein HHK36_025429 [Tetracentron sinense]|uniref:Protein EARLY FLOWERING 4 domain-containing protein n=1 Tax=Tetracentron sinense TaxID=13715 RepID=A0A834YHI3_TETSI|nr:hypothetical protein HHK36_025429 [Tetracentron sinense]
MYSKFLLCLVSDFRSSLQSLGPGEAEIRFNLRSFSSVPRKYLFICVFSQENVPDFQGLGSGTQVDHKVLHTFQKSFVQVQNILDQNRSLIYEINQNHESQIPDNLSRNVGLIRELNNNIRRVVDLYADLSSSFTKSMGTSSEGDSSGKPDQKRIRSG